MKNKKEMNELLYDCEHIDRTLSMIEWYFQEKYDEDDPDTRLFEWLDFSRRCVYHVYEQIEEEMNK